MPQTQNRSHKKEILASAVIVVVLIVGIWYLASKKEFVAVSTGVHDQIRTGDLQGAIQSAEKIAESDANENGKARSIILTSTLKYEISGNLEDAYASIRELKEIIRSTKYSQTVHANALTALAAWPHVAADEAVLQEVFSGEYYGDLVPNNREASVRNLLLKARDQWPSVENTSALAVSYAGEVYFTTDLDPTFKRKNLSPQVVNDSLALADRYLLEAEALASQINFNEGVPFVSYLYQNAFSAAVMAKNNFGGYRTTYKKRFEDAIATMSKGNAGDKRWLALTEWRYASMLMDIDEDATSSQEYLAKAIEAVNESPVKGQDKLVQFIRNTPASNDGKITPAMRLTMDASPEFKAFVESIK